MKFHVVNFLLPLSAVYFQDDNFEESLRRSGDVKEIRALDLAGTVILSFFLFKVSISFDSTPIHALHLPKELRISMKQEGVRYHLL